MREIRDIQAETLDVGFELARVRLKLADLDLKCEDVETVDDLLKEAEEGLRKAAFMTDESLSLEFPRTEEPGGSLAGLETPPVLAGPAGRGGPSR